jgi:uncharacterized protein YdaU (DUF1376 family)
MNHYPFHIGDFNMTTRHLTRVERSLYRECLDMYYRDERPLPTTDFEKLARKLLAVTVEEKTALQAVLDEFFFVDGEGYRNLRCDDVILAYHHNQEKQSLAGKASAEKRRQANVQLSSNGRSTPVEPVFNQPKPETKNQEPIDKPRASRPASKKTQMPADFGISDRVRDWAAKEKHSQLDKHLAAFRISCQAKGYSYVDWDAAFMNAIRGNWAKIEPTAQQQLASTPRKPDKYDLADLDYEKRYGTPESIKALTAKWTGASA